MNVSRVQLCCSDRLGNANAHGWKNLYKILKSRHDNHYEFRLDKQDGRAHAIR
jgi:hypothetical protein